MRIDVFKRLSLIPAVAFVLSVIGCAQQYSRDETPDDEAMKRARAEGKTAEDAAREYFLPKYYFNPDKPDQKVPNYFEGMDRIAVLPGWKPADGPPLATPVYQLFDPDEPTPEFRVVHPLETQNEILGRNTWMIWCAGNEGFWDWLASDSLGFIDLLKIVDSRTRATRFDKAGLINEPGMMQSGAASKDDFGLWLDIPADGATRKWRANYLRQTFDQLRDGKHESQRGQKRYERKQMAEMGAAGYPTTSDNPGDPTKKYDDDEKEKADAKYYPPPKIYGLSSGVVGLRLYPNPNFDAEARKKWDPERYYNDQDYFDDPQVVRPYRVGMACAFCHASFHPLNPPRDVTNPGWENISGNIGAQYLRIRAAFGNLLKPDNFVYHILDSQPPGTIDTSLIASDNINNPNTMNSVFNLSQRALLSLRNPKEVLNASSASQPSIWRHPEANPLPNAEDKVPDYFQKIFAAQGLSDEAENSNSNPRRVPRILLDGSDSIGAWTALARVYLNIGTYYEQWIRLHRTVVGFDKQKPFTIDDCEKHSVYWHATQLRVAGLRDYFLKATPPMPLLATANASDRLAPIDLPKLRARAKDEKVDFLKLLAREKALRIDRSKLADGRKVFAKNCIVCHSSIQPESSAVTLFDKQEDRDKHEQRFAELIRERMKSRADSATLGEFWEHDPAQWLRNDDYVAWAEDVIEKEKFWQLNFLSTDYRIPINLVNTNAGRAMATNALDGNMWDDFAPESYQRMPSVGSIQFFNPYKKEDNGADSFTPRHRVRNDAPDGGGGPGFYRVPTLVSIWATAPLLHNNSLGLFNNDPSVDGRLQAFDDAIRKLLWPERRLESSSYNGATADRLRRDHGLIWRTTEDTYLTLSGHRVPTLLAADVPAVMELSERYPWLAEVRPLWLPSAILLLASFFMLLVDTPKKRRWVGGVTLFLAAVCFVLGLLHNKMGWFSWLDAIQPRWLPIVLLVLIGLIFLAIDSKRTLRYLAYAVLITAVIGFLLYFFGGKLEWLAQLQRFVSVSWLSVILVVTGLFLLLMEGAKELRYIVVGVLLVLATFGILVYAHDANLSATKWSDAIGPVWIYSIFLVAGAFVLLTPDPRELARHVGYATLVLSLAIGLLFYFLGGKLGDVRIGPIPKGTPVNLLANLNPDADPKELKQAIKTTLGALAEIESKHLDERTAQELLRDKVGPALMKVNKCPDFVMDKGHYYEWFKNMTDEDKESLIELLKTF